MAKQNSTKIIVGSRKHAVRVYEVGQRFAHAATVTIGGVKYESRDVPYGMRAQAIESLLERVQRKHPGAAVCCIPRERSGRVRQTRQRGTTTMTKQEAIEYVQSCGEDEGPESYEEAAEVFEALYGRAPDAEDGDQGDVWSLCCAAGWVRVAPEERERHANDRRNQKEPVHARPRR